MYDQIQTALTIAIEVIALIGFIGLPTHAIVTHHINTVRSWGTPQSIQHFLLLWSTVSKNKI
jgi:hypothetical protein